VALVSPQSRSVVVEERKRSIERRLRAAEDAFAPASVEEIAVQLKALCDIYNRELSELAAGIYIDILRQPASVIAAAVRRHIETSKWFPQPSELLDLCQELRWPLEVELENVQAEVQWTKDPAFGRTKAQLMAECRVMYGQYATAEDTEWMLWHLGTAPPVPPPPEHLSDEARAAIEIQTRAEWEAKQQRLAAVLKEAKRINERKGLPQMPFDQWGRKRRGDVEAAAATIWRDPEPSEEERDG
jgi:hypothetical protein